METILTEEDPTALEIMRLFDIADKYYDSLYPSDSNHPISADEIVKKKGLFVVAKNRNRIIGHVALVNLSDNEAEVKRLFVLPEYRRHGIGNRLMLDAIKKAKERKIIKLYLETGIKQPAAIKLYEKLKFNEIAAFSPYLPDENSIFFMSEI